MIPLVCRYEPGVLQSCSKAGEFLLDLVVVVVEGRCGWAGEFPSFELFCTEAFQFDYEAPFHRALMQRAAQNESEPWADWLSVGLTVAALWGRNWGAPTPTTPSASPYLLSQKQGIRKGHRVWVAGQVGQWAREWRPRAVKGLKGGRGSLGVGSLFVHPAPAPGRGQKQQRVMRRWLGSVTDDQVTKAEDVTAARFSVSNHRSLFTYLIGAALPEEFSAYIFRLFAVPRSVTTWLHHSDQPSNWSSETKSAVLFYSILFTTYVDV